MLARRMKLWKGSARKEELVSISVLVRVLVHFYSGTSELSVTSVTQELTAMGFDVWDTYLGAQGVTLSRTPLTHPSQ